MDNVPISVDEEATVPVPFLTMAELVFAEDCQVCADRGTTHIPDDEL